jgi:hypothetical protein
MSLQRFNPATLIILLLIAVVAALRVLLNFNLEDGGIAEIALYSPIGAMAIFGGSRFDKAWKAILFPLGALFLSDLILHQTVFKSYNSGLLYKDWAWVYVAYLLMLLAGRFMMRKPAISNFIGTVLVATLIHWIVTDLGVWYSSNAYSKDLQGFLDCLVAAIPFEWRFLVATTVYGAILFGGYAFIQRRYPEMRVAGN